MWPAFWMLGNNIGAAGWPECGEIDIMENIGKEPSVVHGTIHGPGYSGANGLGESFTLPSGKFANNFLHQFVQPNHLPIDGLPAKPAEFQQIPKQRFHPNASVDDAIQVMSPVGA